MDDTRSGRISKMNAGALARCVIDAVHMTGDDLDIAQEDFEEAMVLLSDLAQRQQEKPERAAMQAIVLVLVQLRREMHEIGIAEAIAEAERS